MEKLIDEVLSYEKTKAKWRNNYTSHEWQQANKLNKMQFKIGLNQSSGCQCLEDLFFYIKRVNFKENLKIMSNKQFKIKDGKLLMVHGFPPMSNNTPDEDFIKMLKMNPALITSLASYPSNWKDIVNGKKVKVEVKEVEETEVKEEVVEGQKELSEMSVKELQELCESKGVKFHHKSGKEKLISLINA